MKVYRETLYKILEDQGSSAKRLSEDLGYSSCYISQRFSKGRGWYDFKKVDMLGMSKLLNCNEKELAAIPVSSRSLDKSTKATQEEIAKRDEQIRELRQLVLDGFKMIHEDINVLIDVMHKYWKPEYPEVSIDRGQGDDKQ